MSAVVRPTRAVAALVTLAFAVVLGAGQAAHADTGVPYQDPNAIGSIGLCDKAGNSVTHGSIDTTPFVWRAVSSVAAKAPYNGAGRTASLLAYQPRKGLAPGQWSGESLTAAADYSNPVHPMAAATDRDYPLKYFVEDYPPQWDGLIELRLYLGAPDHPTDSVTYAATDIKVTGSTWRVVSGASVSCHSGTAESIETILLPKSTPSAKASAHGKPPAAGTSSGPAAGASASSASTPAASGSGTAAASSASAAGTHRKSSGLGSGAVAAIVIAAIVVVAGVAYLVFRRRRSTPSGPPSPGPTTDSSSLSAHGNSEKGQ